MIKATKLNSIMPINQNELDDVIGGQLNIGLTCLALVGIDIIVMTGVISYYKCRYGKEMHSLKKFKESWSL